MVRAETTSPTPEPFDTGRLHKDLASLGYQFVYLPQTTSTMDNARAAGVIPTVVVTNHQTQGRGRVGRNWHDTPGKSVLMTIAEPFNEVDGDPDGSSQLPHQLFTLAACLALQEVTANKHILIKWPNDLVYADASQPDTFGKKIGGVLIENPDHSPSHMYPRLFGLGVNVSYLPQETALLPAEYGAVSLSEITAQPLDRSDIILAIVKRWSSLRTLLRQENSMTTDIARLWHDNAAMLNKTVYV